MLYYFKFMTDWWGPFRMFGSHLFLLCLGAAIAALVIWIYLPKFYRLMPRDRGKKFVKQGEISAGKPTGAGLFIFLLTLPALLLVLPMDDALIGMRDFAWATPNKQWGVVLCLFAAMLTGWYDDKSDKPWGRTKKGLLDAAVCIATALIMCGFYQTKTTVLEVGGEIGTFKEVTGWGLQNVKIWLPFTKTVFDLPWWGYVLVATPVLWLSMNATNCTDGVDGLAGSLTLLTLFTLAIFLYIAVGHTDIARYLLVPHNPEGARWAILTVTLGGAVAGHLWHNAEPSNVLMGDAGSRALGLLVGVAALACGNPLLIFVVAPIVLVNGGTGLLKILLLKMLAKMDFDITKPQTEKASSQCWAVRALHSVRFPLHDHFKYNIKPGWSNAQVLMRFILIQALLMPILLVLFLKIR